jgi:multiple sugar transport system substrate-binding protein
MFTRKPFLAMLLTSLFFASTLLASCAGGGGGQQSGVTTLKVWFPGSPTPSGPEFSLVTKQLVPEFEKANPGIKVDLQYVPWENLSPKLNSAFAGGIAPDVFGHGPAAAADFVANDRVLPLDTYINSLDANTREDFGTILDGGLVGSKRYMVPLSGQGFLIAYRTDLFREAGLNPDNPPRTWEELRAAAEKLTKRNGNTITRVGFISNLEGYNVQQTFATFLIQAGGSLLSDDGRTITWSSPAGVKALQYMVDLYHGAQPVAKDLHSYTLPAAQQPLVTGQAAMALVETGVLNNIYLSAPDTMKNIAIMPSLKDAQQGAFGGPGPGLFINKDSKHPDLAWRFIKFMMDANTLKSYYSVTSGIPARSSFIKSDLVQKKPFLKQFIAAYSTFKPNPNVQNWVQIRDTLSRHLAQAMAQQVTPQAALDAAAKEAAPLVGK